MNVTKQGQETRSDARGREAASFDGVTREAGKATCDFRGGQELTLKQGLHWCVEDGRGEGASHEISFLQGPSHSEDFGFRLSTMGNMVGVGYSPYILLACLHVYFIYLLYNLGVIFISLLVAGWHNCVCLARAKLHLGMTSCNKHCAV